MNRAPLRLGILGGGAIARFVYLPVLKGMKEFDVVLLIDRNGPVAEALAAEAGIPAVGTDWKDMIGRVDAVLNLLPNHLHAEVTIALVNAGIPVLVEKPMALGSADCGAMARAAEAAGVTLAVGMVRRFFAQNQFIKALLERGALGRIQTVEVEEGVVFDWPLASGALFDRKQSGGGVLMDVGVHVLDLLHWWFGPGHCVDYQDDAAGGIETDCSLRVSYAGGIEAVVRLSRVRNLGNRLRLKGSAGEIECDLKCGAQPLLSFGDGTPGFRGTADLAGPKGQKTKDAFASQLKDFHRAIVAAASPRVPVADGAAVIELIERCYAARAPAVVLSSAVAFPLAGKKVLITGGTGFIGAALAERLAAAGSSVQVLVRNFAKASRISRLGVQMVPGDLLDGASLDRAVQGCGIVYHCAYGNRGDDRLRSATNVDGTRHLLAAAEAAGVRRLVHVSTQSVYGLTRRATLDESAPRQPGADAYGASKLAAENLVLDFGHRTGIPVIVLQPTAVYGPFAPSYTERILRRMQTHRLVLINGGEGVCNAVFIDDLVAALLAAATAEAAGGCFLISGPTPCRWRDFMGAYEDMAGRVATVSMSEAEAAAFYRASNRKRWAAAELLRILRTNPEVRSRLGATREGSWLRACRGLLTPILRRPAAASQPPPACSPGAIPAPLLALDPASIRFFAQTTQVDIGKARRLLGYQPRHDLGSGMALTKAWARWAGLIHDTTSQHD